MHELKARAPAGLFFLLIAGLAGLMPGVAASQSSEAGVGRIVITLGSCRDAHVAPPGLFIRKVDGRERRSLRWALFSNQAAYTDETGRFRVIVEKLEPGEWEVYNHEILGAQAGGGASAHRSRADYSLRFTVEPGKVTDLGRFCSDAQTSADRYPNYSQLFNRNVTVAYLMISANREEDLNRARQSDGASQPREVVRALLARAGEISPLLRTSHIEPRVIVTDIAPIEQPAPFPPR